MNHKELHSQLSKVLSGLVDGQVPIEYAKEYFKGAGKLIENCKNELIAISMGAEIDVPLLEIKASESGDLISIKNNSAELMSLQQPKNSNVNKRVTEINIEDIDGKRAEWNLKPTAFIKKFLNQYDKSTSATIIAFYSKITGKPIKDARNLICNAMSRLKQRNIIHGVKESFDAQTYYYLITNGNDPQ